MKILSWIARGLYTSSKCSILRKLILKHKAEMLLIQAKKLERLCKIQMSNLSVTNDWEWFLVPLNGSSWGLLCIWNNKKWWSSIFKFVISNFAKLYAVKRLWSIRNHSLSFLWILIGWWNLSCLDCGSFYVYFIVIFWVTVAVECFYEILQGHLLCI